MIYESSDDNADIIAEIYSSFGQGDALAKITEATGYDGFIKDDVFVVFSPNQIKSATDNIGIFDLNNPDIRFLKEYNSDEPFVPDSDKERMITVLMGVDTEQLNSWDYQTAQEYLASKLFDVNDNTAQSILNTARTRKRQAIQKGNMKRLQRERQTFAMEAYPFYRIATELLGDDLKGKIIPTERQKGIEMSGSFIHPWFKHEPDWQKKHAADRPKGNTDEIAQRASNELGRDVDENEIIEFFNGFTIAQINSDYSKLKATQREEDAYFTRIAQEEWEAQETQRIQSEVERIMEATYADDEIPISREWAEQNQDIVIAINEAVTGEKVSFKQIDLEFINNAIKHKGADYAQGFREGKLIEKEQYMAALSDMRKTILADPELAKDFANTEFGSQFTAKTLQQLAELVKYDTTPTKEYPIGRRAYEFNKIMESLHEKRIEANKKKELQKIKDLLEKSKDKRTLKGHLISTVPTARDMIQSIKDIINLNEGAIANLLNYNLMKIAELENSTSDENTDLQMNKLKEQNELLYTFGNLENKSAADISNAYDVLARIYNGAKEKYYLKLANRQSQLDDWRRSAIKEITPGMTINLKKEHENSGVLDAFLNSDFILNMEHFKTVMEQLSTTKIDDFENSTAGEIYKKIVDGLRQRETQINSIQDELIYALRDIVGIKNNFELRKFMNDFSEVKNTGIFKNIYIKSDAGEKKRKQEIIIRGKRPVVTKEIHIDKARKILEDYRNGEKITIDGITLPDIAVYFLERQIADYDSGLQVQYDLYGDDVDNTAIQMIKNEGKKQSPYMQLIMPAEAKVEKEELKLSKDSALNILLAWEQKDARMNMEWNGWTEENIQQLKKFIGEKGIKLGYKLRSIIKDYSIELVKVIFDCSIV
jgi:hypothetical protein